VLKTFLYTRLEVGKTAGGPSALLALCKKGILLESLSVFRRPQRRRSTERERDMGPLSRFMLPTSLELI
jgi:hypothetical protein